jgi:hypothetical protein
VAAVLIVFVITLALWVGNPNRGRSLPHVADPGPSSSASPSGSGLPSGTTSSGSTSASPGTSPASAGGGLGNLSLPPVTGGQDYGPGIHHVVLTATSDNTIGAVGYLFRNGNPNGVKKYAVPSSFTVSEIVEGGPPLAVIAVQAAQYATVATCSVSVDGIVRQTHTAHGPNRVVVCFG